MIFGNEEIRDEVNYDIKEIEKKFNIKIIYAAETGSISKGCQCFTSDYDTRFLYLHNDFPQRYFNPQNCNLEDIKMLLYPLKKYDSDKYELRELTSYLHFLLHPSINGICKDYGLYYYLGYTFMAPYVWDPLGLKSKLLPLMNGIFFAPYLLYFHNSQIETYFTNEILISAKNYLRCIFSALCIEWVQRFNTFPPCYIESLMVFCQNKNLPIHITGLINLYRSESRNIFNAEVNVNHNKLIDDYIEEEKQIAQDLFINGLIMDNEIREYIETIVNKMYEIIYHSMNEEIVKGIND